jgi:ribosome-associated protein
MTDDTSPSKSQRKREMLALQELGERLVALPQSRLDRVELPTTLRDAVLEARRINARGGRKRQLQFIGRLMREVDARPIEEALARMDGADRAGTALLHQAEHWRERLLADGDDALAEFVERHPGVDRQHMRRLQRSARTERDGGSAPRDQRALFRLVSETLRAEGE